MIKTVICFDPGYDRLGWAVGEIVDRQVRVIAFNLISTDKNQTWENRLADIQRALTSLIKQYSPSEAGIEQVFFSRNTKTALKVAEVRGLIAAEILRAKIKIHQLSPQAVKLAATGNGHADKFAMRKMVGLALNVDARQLVDDTVDALAMLLAIPS